MRKWYSLIDKVYDMDKLHEAFKKIKRNKGSKTCGVDGVDIASYEANLYDNLHQLSVSLKSCDYTPKPVRRIYILKPDGSKRALGIPTIEDRVVQQSLLNVLQPIFDPTFHPSSYGYRPKLSAHHAVAKAERFARYYNFKHVVDMDLSKCFDTLNHKLILQSVNHMVSDGKVLGLIEKFLKSGVMEENEFHPTSMGSPQGGIISPLLMNIYLDSFDQYMRSRKIRIVRYADDILVFARSGSQAFEYKLIAEKYLEHELKLTINRKKTHITKLEKGIPYLGFVIKSHGVIISSDKIEIFKDKARKLTPRSTGKSIHYYIKELNYLLRGFSNYYRIARAKTHFINLMSWVRRRLRMMIMKAWKSWKPLFRLLRRLGWRGKFVKINMSKWRNSNIPPVCFVLSNKRFDNAKLFNMGKVVANTLHQYV